MSDEKDSPVSNGLRVIGNDIFFYMGIDDNSAAALNLEMTNIVMNSKVDLNTPKQINLHINSCGGSIDATIAIADTIRLMVSNGVQINTIIEGVALSGGAFMTLYASNRLIYKNATVMVHYGKATYDGGYPVDDYIGNHFTYKKILERMMVETTKLSLSEVKKLLTNDQLQMTPAQCLKIGMVDKII